MKEQRKHARIETKALVDYTGTNALLDHKIRDISIGGLRIETEFLEEEGTEVDLYISLPEIDEGFEAKGVVAWMNDDEPKDMGIKFTQISEEAKAVLKRYLDFLKK
jgi:uncharacterized protein (TIGR02266 family)